MSGTAIIIGQLQTCRCVERQLDLLDDRPVILGWVLAGGPSPEPGDPVIGRVDDLEPLLARRSPGLALVSLPASMGELIQDVRTRLRRAGVPDRFFPTVPDLLDGVGPRSRLTIDLSMLLDRAPRRIDSGAIRDVLAGRHVLITGAGGSIGAELTRVAARFRPSRLTLVDRSEGALFEIDRQIARFHPDLPRKAVLHDVVDADGTLEQFLRMRPEVVFHAAAHKHVPMMEDHPAAAVDNNLFGTKSVADASDAAGVERFVMISTDKAVNPVSVMGATKRLAEMYIQCMNHRSSTGFSMVRFGNVLGSSGSVLDIWARQIDEGGPMTVTDARMTRYFMTIPEAAALVTQAAALFNPDERSAEVFVLDMGEPVKILDLARRFVRLHGLEPVPPGDPSPASIGTIEVVYTGVRPGERLHEELARDVEALQPTRHDGIKIWALPTPDPQLVEEFTTQLAVTQRPRDRDALVNAIFGFLGSQTRQGIPVAA
jgi:FlaA1/EpsC-like NDP-sugar epimerase